MVPNDRVETEKYVNIRGRENVHGDEKPEEIIVGTLMRWKATEKQLTC